MPIDQSKVVDLLRYQSDFRQRILADIPNYEQIQKNPQFENGILTMINELSFGEMRELTRDIGISNDTLEFYNIADLQKKKESLQAFPSDS